MEFMSELTPYRYKEEMRSSLSSITDFGLERFTGFVVGSFFMITHHSAYEWNRKVTSEKHSAIGVVSPEGAGSKITCIRMAGALNPISFVFLVVLCQVILLVSGITEIVDSFWTSLLISVGVSFLIACASALQDSMTEQGQEGYATLSAFLLNPSDYY